MSHAYDLRDEVNGDIEFVRAVVRDWQSAPLTEKEKALLAYAVKLTRTPQQMTRADVDALRRCGWSDGDVHDATQVIAYFNYINRIADGLGVEPDPWLLEFVEELGIHEWKKSWSEE